MNSSLRRLLSSLLTMVVCHLTVLPLAAFSPPEEPAYGGAMLARIYSGGLVLTPSGNHSGVHVKDPDVELKPGDAIVTSSGDRVDIRLDRGTLLRMAGKCSLRLIDNRAVILQEGLLYIHSRRESGRFQVQLRDLLIHSEDGEWVAGMDQGVTRDQFLEVWNGSVAVTHVPTGERLSLRTGMSAVTQGYPPGGILHLDEFNPLDAHRTWAREWPAPWSRTLPGRDRSLRLLERQRVERDARAIDRLEGRKSTVTDITLPPPDRWTARQRAARSRILRNLRKESPPEAQVRDLPEPVRDRTPSPTEFIDRPSGSRIRQRLDERLK